MSGLSLLCLAVGLVQAGQPPETPAVDIGSYLYAPAYALDHELRGTPTPYALQPGDICFAVNQHWASRMGHRLSGAGLPNHSMLVFAMSDGQLGIVEAGPHSVLAIKVIEAYSHLRSYEDEGSRVWVRRRRTPLTPDQSARLTEFCLRQDGKKFPIVRLGAQLTPLRSRTPLRAAWTGQVDPDKRRYFCSELVLNAFAEAGVLDPEPLRPSATYPSDLFYGESKNRFVNRGVRLLECDWDPPARWTQCAGGAKPNR